MKALFCHDHYYYSDGNKILSKGQYANTIWQRYLIHFDSLTVIGRNGGQGNSQEKNINISSAPNVTFQLFKNINSIRGILFSRKKRPRYFTSRPYKQMTTN